MINIQQVCFGQLYVVFNLRYCCNRAHNTVQDSI